MPAKSTRRGAPARGGAPMGGRPTTYSDAITDEICERLANGESLRAIVKSDHMPAQSTVFKWLAAHPSFAERYARAREAQADALADEIIHIANTPILGETVTDKPGGAETRRGDMIEHRRLQIDARKWFVAKLFPKKYGDRTTIAGDADAPLAVTVDLASLPTDQLSALASIAAGLASRKPDSSGEG